MSKCWIWAFLLLYIGQLVSDEAVMGIFSILAKLMMTDGRILMIAGGLDVLYLSAIAVIAAFLTVRLMQKKHGSFFKSFRARRLKTTGVSDRFFESNHIPALKKCPNCPEQLPLSALICEACDYNFLSGMVGRGQKLLPSPEPMTHELSEQRFASAGL